MDPFGEVPLTSLDLSAGVLRPSFMTRLLEEVQRINLNLTERAKRRGITLGEAISGLDAGEVGRLLPPSFLTIDVHSTDVTQWLDDRGLGPVMGVHDLAGKLSLMVGPVEESADLLNLDPDLMLAADVSTRVKHQLVLACEDWKQQGAVMVPPKTGGTCRQTQDGANNGGKKKNSSRKMKAKPTKTSKTSELINIKKENRRP